MRTEPPTTPLEQVHDAAAMRPERLPGRSAAESHFGVRLFEPETFEDMRRNGFEPGERASMLATAQWLQWRDEVQQQNRSRFGAVLWAFTQLYQVQPDLAQRQALAESVAAALQAFGWPRQTPVPHTWQARRRFVEAWGTEAFRYLCQEARELGAA